MRTSRDRDLWQLGLCGGFYLLMETTRKQLELVRGIYQQIYPYIKGLRSSRLWREFYARKRPTQPINCRYAFSFRGTIPIAGTIHFNSTIFSIQMSDDLYLRWLVAGLPKPLSYPQLQIIELSSPPRAAFEWLKYHFRLFDVCLRVARR